MKNVVFLACLVLVSCQSGDAPEAETGPVLKPETGPPTEETSKLSGCADCPEIPAFLPSTVATPRTIHVSVFGATGGGQNEEFEIQSAINAAGDGGRVVFESGRVYTVCQILRPRVNQLWQPSSSTTATLKRCDTPVTTLLADAPAGATSVAVSSTAAFVPGMWISPVLNGADDFYAGELPNHPIYNITGNVLNFHNGLERSYRAGDKVVTSFAMVTDANGVVFEGLVFDGNAAENDHFVSWARHSSLWLKAQDSEVRHSTFINAQGDAISVQGLDNVIEHNTFTNLNGSAMHFSAARQTIARSNHLTQTNLQAERVAHAEAALTWSLGNKDLLIEDNCIQDIPASAFGHILVHGDNYGADIRGNQVCRVDSLLNVVTNTNLSMDLLFTDNTVANAGRLDLIGDNSTLNGIEISDNRFDNSAVYTKNVSDLIINENAFTLTSDADLNDAAESANNKVATVTIRGGANITIADNTLDGGRKGVQVFNALNRVSNVSITGNRISEHDENGLLIGHLSSIDSSDPIQSDFAGITVSNNTFVNDQTSASRATVELGRRTNFNANCVESSGVGVRVHGYPSVTATSGWQISGNTVDSLGASFLANEPFTHGVQIFDNTASNGITGTLVSNNPGSTQPGPLLGGCP